MVEPGLNFALESRRSWQRPDLLSPPAFVAVCWIPTSAADLDHWCRLFNTAPNLFYVSPDEVLYYTVGVGIKYNKRLNTQCFFLRHTDDIHCIAYCEERKLAATGQVRPPPPLPYLKGEEREPLHVAWIASADPLPSLRFG